MDRLNYPFSRQENVPEGVYRVKILEAYETVSRNGNEMTTVIFCMLDRPSIGTWLWHHFLTDRPGALRQMRFLHKAVGIPMNEAVNPEDLSGKRLRVALVPMSFKGKEHPKVVRFLPFD